LIKDGRSIKTANNHGGRFRRFLRWAADPDGGALIDLRVRDFDLEHGTVTISRTVWQAKQSTPAYVKAPKGGHFDRVPIPPILISRLERAIAGRGPDALIFPAPDGERLTRWQLGGVVKRAARRAKLSALGWHALRHSFCSNLARAGGPIPTVSKLMRHHDITTTMRYVHVLDRDLRDGSEALARLYGGGSAAPHGAATDAGSGSSTGPRRDDGPRADRGLVR
jgi:integrase